MNIKPLDTTLKTLLESGFYKIPRFQRPYSWDQENVEDFWQDTVVAEDKDYFIGSFVFWKDSKTDDLFYVVDGQQRLTTVTILFSALRNLFDSENQNTLALGMHKLIERKDINNESLFVLRSDTSYPYLQEFIQKHGKPEVEPEIGSEEIALKKAYDFLYNKIKSLVLSININPTKSEDDKSKEIKNALLSIRNKLLRLKLIVIELDNEDDAYLVFETLNTRGKDLTVSDLVKNYLIRLLKPKTKGVDTAKDKWLNIQKGFDEAEVDININSFLLYSWLSRYQYTSQKKLYKEIKKEIKRKDAAKYLDSILKDSKLYRKLVEPSVFKWDNQIRSIKDSIIALNIFRVAQPLPMMLAILRELESDLITKKQAKLAFQALENFHLQFTAITSQRIGGFTARLYSTSAYQLHAAIGKDQKNCVIKEFIDKIRERNPKFEEFEVDFIELVYTSTQTRQKNLIKYILSLFDKYWCNNKTVADYDLLTIEHIAPESGGDDWAVSSEIIGKIGNLILVTEQVNDALSNKSFQEKIDILKENNIPMDKYLVNSHSWTDQQINKRNRNLAKLAYNNIFKF